jgi:hypothetical protein
VEARERRLRRRAPGGRPAARARTARARRGRPRATTSRRRSRRRGTWPAHRRSCGSRPCGTPRAGSASDPHAPGACCPTSGGSAAAPRSPDEGAARAPCRASADPARHGTFGAAVSRTRLRAPRPEAPSTAPHPRVSRGRTRPDSGRRGGPRRQGRPRARVRANRLPRRASHPRCACARRPTKARGLDPPWP